MSVIAPRVSRTARIGELALWTSAAVLMLSAHVAAAMYMMQQEPIEAGDSAPPPAIMIELAPEPEAVNTQDDQVAPDMQDAQEVKSETVEPVEEPQPEPVPEPIPDPVEPPPEIAEPVEPDPVEPVEQVQEATPEIAEAVPEPPPEPVEEIDPVAQQMIAALENVEVPLPVSRPPPPVEKPPEDKKAEAKTPPAKRPPPKPRPQQQPASAAMAEAKAQTRESTRTAASQNSATSGSSSVSPARWASRVMSHLQRRKRYPKEAEREGQQGTVQVRFSIDTGGNVLSVSVSRSSGYPLLDNAVVDLVKRASPVPAPPAGVNRNVTVPMTFEAR